MTETKSPEALLQDALLAEQNKSKQLEIERNTERDERGKAEQALRVANTKAEQLARELTDERTAHGKTQKELKDSTKLVDDLTEQLADDSDAPKAHTATLGSGASAKTYRFTAPRFYIAGLGAVVAEEVKNNSDVLKKLVEAGSKVIELVPGK